MTERERLLKLVNSFMENATNELLYGGDFDDLFTDYLLDNGVIVPPCKVGDSIYYIDPDTDNNGKFYLGIFEGKIKTIALEDDGLWIYCSYNDGLTLWHKIANDLNKTVFLNRVEAEKALKEREK